MRNGDLFLYTLYLGDEVDLLNDTRLCWESTDFPQYSINDNNTRVRCHLVHIYIPSEISREEFTFTHFSLGPSQGRHMENISCKFSI